MTKTPTEGLEAFFAELRKEYGDPADPLNHPDVFVNAQPGLDGPVTYRQFARALEDFARLQAERDRAVDLLRPFGEAARLAVIGGRPPFEFVSANDYQRAADFAATLPPPVKEAEPEPVAWQDEIIRHLSHEEWRGLRIDSYRYKVEIPPEVRGSEWAWGYCSHWSTHPGAEPLVSVSDVAALMATTPPALQAAREEASGAGEPVAWPHPMPLPPKLQDPRYGVYLDLRDLVMVGYRHSRANPTCARLAEFIEKNYGGYLATCSEIELTPPTSPPNPQARIEALEGALREAQSVLAMLVEPGAIQQTTVINAYAAAKTAEAKARAALTGEKG